MKKSVIILISLIIILLALGLFWYFDNTKIIEQPLNEVVQIAKSKDGENISGFPYAYTIEKTDSKIELTLYMADEAVKSIHTFSIVDGIISDTNYEKHYISKITAKNDNNTIINKKRKANVVSGQLESDIEAIGKDANTYYNDLLNAYSHLKYLD